MPIFPIELNRFSRFEDRFLETKSTNNQLKNGIQDSMSKFSPLWTENRAQDTFKTPPWFPHEAPRRSLQLALLAEPAWGRKRRSELTFFSMIFATRRSELAFSNDFAPTNDLDLRFPIFGGYMTLWYNVLQCLWASDALVSIFVMQNRIEKV